jgi:uncharacterized tellurite resistance protein B-like protein
MKKSIAHIFNLIAMAIRDNDFDDKEKTIIIRIAARLGLSVKDIENVLNKNIIKIEVPLTLAERIEHLHDLVSVMLADGIIHEEEMKYIARFIKIYGFDDNYNGNPVVVDLNNIKNQLSFQKFLMEYRKITAEDLSTVVVDKNLEIKFPSYNYQQLTLGPLPKTLYIFFLIQKEPLHIKELCDPRHKKLLCEIYSLMPNSDSEVKARIDNLTDTNGFIFNSNRSIIKRCLSHVLPANNADLLNQYIIYGAKNQKKYIQLNKELIQIQPKIV